MTKDKKTKRQKDKRQRQRPKRVLNIATSGQFRTLAMFSGKLTNGIHNVGFGWSPNCCEIVVLDSQIQLGCDI